MAKNIELTIVGAILAITIGFGIYLTCQMIYATYIMYGVWWFVFYIISGIASMIFAVEFARIITR